MSNLHSSIIVYSSQIKLRQEWTDEVIHQLPALCVVGVYTRQPWVILGDEHLLC
jgi:hypothetical protein